MKGNCTSLKFALKNTYYGVSPQFKTLKSYGVTIENFRVKSIHNILWRQNIISPFEVSQNKYFPENSSASTHRFSALYQIIILTS